LTLFSSLWSYLKSQEGKISNKKEKKNEIARKSEKKRKTERAIIYNKREEDSNDR